MAALIAIGALLMILIDRRDETGLTAITIAVIMIIAASNPEDPWRQPLLRLVDTNVGITVGVACKWVGHLCFLGSGAKRCDDLGRSLNARRLHT
jgi:hypothetical protein